MISFASAGMKSQFLYQIRIIYVEWMMKLCIREFAFLCLSRLNIRHHLMIFFFKNWVSTDCLWVACRHRGQLTHNLSSNWHCSTFWFNVFVVVHLYNVFLSYDCVPPIGNIWHIFENLLNRMWSARQEQRNAADSRTRICKYQYLPPTVVIVN